MLLRDCGRRFAQKGIERPCELVPLGHNDRPEYEGVGSAAVMDGGFERGKKANANVGIMRHRAQDEYVLQGHVRCAHVLADRILPFHCT